jgi:hypothetical protein
VEVLRHGVADDGTRSVPEFGKKQAQKVRLGNENDSVHTLHRSAFVENHGELVRETPRCTFMMRIAAIRRVASLRMTVETPLGPGFQVPVFGPSSRLIDGPEKNELSPFVLEQPTTNATRDQNPG